MLEGSQGGACGTFVPHSWIGGVCGVCRRPEAAHRLLELEEKLGVPLDMRFRAASVNDPQLELRGLVVREIIATEATYVVSLRTISELYIEPLTLLAASGAGWITHADIKAIFSNVEAIADLNANFLLDLEARVAAGPSPGDASVGDPFLTFGPFFKLYSQYCSDNEASSTRLQELLKDSTAAAWFAAPALTQAGPLTALLLLPIQRVPCYALLLAELRKRYVST